MHGKIRAAAPCIRAESKCSSWGEGAEVWLMTVALTPIGCSAEQIRPLTSVNHFGAEWPRCENGPAEAFPARA